MSRRVLVILVAAGLLLGALSLSFYLHKSVEARRQLMEAQG